MYYLPTFLIPGAPLPPVSVNTTSCANFSTTLTWDIRLLPDLLPPDGFLIEWAAKYFSSQNFPLTPFSKLAEIPSGSARSYFVDTLKPHNEIHFRIRAKNKIGVGFPGLAPLSPLCITNSKRKYDNDSQVIPYSCMA